MNLFLILAGAANISVAAFVLTDGSYASVNIGMAYACAMLALYWKKEDRK